MNHSQRPVRIHFHQEICAVPPWCPYKLCHEYTVVHTCGPLGTDVTEFRQPLQVQSHLEMPRILVQLGHIQRT